MYCVCVCVGGGGGGGEGESYINDLHLKKLGFFSRVYISGVACSGKVSLHGFLKLL